MSHFAPLRQKQIRRHAWVQNDTIKTARPSPKSLPSDLFLGKGCLLQLWLTLVWIFKMLHDCLKDGDWQKNQDCRVIITEQTQKYRKKSVTTFPENACCFAQLTCQKLTGQKQRAQSQIETSKK